MNQRVSINLLSKSLWDGGIAKASLNRAFIRLMEDPKPGELAMVRVNPVEKPGEARTREPCNTLG